MLWILAIAAAVLAAALAVVSYPLFFQPLEPHRLPVDTDGAFNERDALLEALSDLEQARLSGKMSETDHAAQKSRLEARYIQLVEEKPGQGG